MNDLISKEVVIETLKAVRDLVWDVDIPSPTVPEYIEHHEQMQSIMRNIDILTDKIIKMPSVQPERIRGKWVNYGEGECCDQCGRYPYDDGEFHILGWRSNFCPHCGADMRGEELDETD